MVKNLDPATKKIFIIIPHQAQVSEYYYNNHKLLGAPFQNELFKIPSLEFPIYKKLRNLCSQLNFEFFDPLTEFRETETHRQLYYSNDPHLNVNGSRYLGLILKDKIHEILKK
jgi:hypothetical protein